MGTPSFDDDPDGKKVPEKLRELFKTGQCRHKSNLTLASSPSEYRVFIGERLCCFTL
jgi:hypothetical protein